MILEDTLTPGSMVNVDRKMRNGKAGNGFSGRSGQRQAGFFWEVGGEFWSIIWHDIRPLSFQRSFFSNVVLVFKSWFLMFFG